MNNRNIIMDYIWNKLKWNVKIIMKNINNKKNDLLNKLIKFYSIFIYQCV